jgi:hypothetical protein
LVCHREKSQLVFASGTQSGTPSGTQSGTPSGTQSDTPSDTQSGTPSGTLSCKKMMGNLAVMVLATNDGRIKDMGFSCAHGMLERKDNFAMFFHFHFSKIV